MQSSIAILALVASATATYAPMQTRYNGVQSCIAQDTYSKANKCWSLTVADCSSEEHTFPAFNFATQDGYVKTADNLCLAPVNGAIVLTKCKPATCNGWNYIKGNYWSNSNNCMAYNATLKAVVHVDCDSATAFVLPSCTVPAVPAAPVAPSAVSCPTFANSCPAGKYVPSYYYNYVGDVNSCCVAKPAPTCYDYAVQAGYPRVNPCGAYGEFNPRVQTQSCSGQRDFINNCCVQPAPSTCSALRCPYGYQKIVDADFGVCTGPCKVTDCCEKVAPVNTQTCYQWAGATAPGMATINACGAENLFMNGNAPCAADGSNCKAKCCMPLIYPTTSTAQPEPTLY